MSIVNGRYTNQAFYRQTQRPHTWPWLVADKAVKHRKLIGAAAAGLTSMAVMGRLGRFGPKRPHVGRKYPPSKRPKQNDNVQHGDRNPTHTAITNQHDLEQVYYKNRKRRRMPFKKRRRMKRFKRKVQKVIYKKQPLNYAMFRCSTGRSLGNTGLSPWTLVPAQSVNGAIDTTADWVLWPGGTYNNAPTTTQLFRVINLIKGLQTRKSGVDYTDKTITYNAGTYPANMMIYISHCQIDISIKNEFAAPINYHIYVLVAARDIPQGDLYWTPKIAWNQCHSDSNSLGSTLPTSADLGVTPLNAPGFGKHWKIKSKTNVLVNGLQATALTVKGPKGLYNIGKYADLQAIKGKTTHIMIVAASEINFGNPGGLPTGTVATSMTYHWKWPYTHTGFTDGINNSISLADF